MKATEQTKFEIGKTYSYTFACDADSSVLVKVIKRTAQFVTLQEVHSGAINRCKVFIPKDWDNAEKCHPCGTYSMNPVLSADKEVAA